MRSGYRRLGDFIQPVKERNVDTRYSELLGINIDKYFMPSVANVVGTDLTNYKVVREGQFACNRMHVGRDYRIPIALSRKEDPFIVSPAYDVFEIINPDELNAEYLMMWFSRKEFDRNAWFHTDADVRGGLPWEAFCNLQLPVPSPEKQREIIAEYNTIINRIQLNEQLNQKLEETAQALYKYWFVDFEFPDEYGKPYKSSGGKMVWNEELEKEVPEGWEVASLSEHLDIKHGYAFKGEYIIENENENILLTPGNFQIGGGFKSNRFRYYIGEFPEEYIFKTGDMMVTMTDLSKACDTLGYPALIPNYPNKNFLHNQRLGRVIFKRSDDFKVFYYWLLRTSEYRNEVVGSATGTTVKHTSPTKILEFVFACPLDFKVVIKFCSLTKKLNAFQENLSLENLKLRSFEDLFLSKMTQVEEEKEVVG